MMRLEDLLIRYLPGGGSIGDLRPAADRGQLSFSADAGISMLLDGDIGGADLVIAAPEQLPELQPAVRWTVVVAGTGAADAPLPDALAWASSVSGQLVETSAVLSPRCVALVVAHADDPLLPESAGSVQEPDSPASWKRVAGELVAERFRNTVLTEEADLARDAAQVERDKGAEARRRARKLRRRLDEVLEQPRGTAGLSDKLSGLVRRKR